MFGLVKIQKKSWTRGYRTVQSTHRTMETMDNYPLCFMHAFYYVICLMLLFLYLTFSPQMVKALLVNMTN